MDANLRLIPPTPPLIVASEHSAGDYTCGKCGTLLLQANDRGALKLLIRCADCGAYNSTMIGPG
jgi:DNA-directed RNA polymerase subunit RPC12/RpoP